MATLAGTSDTEQPDARFPAIGAYAAIGDGHTVALVDERGSVDWLCLPTFSGPSVFGALLDRERGGRFALAPAIDHEVERRYIPRTNVLETTYSTAKGTVRVTDGMNLGAVGLLPGTELVRRVEGRSGSVPMRWVVEPRFEYGQCEALVERRAGVPVASHGETYLAVLSFDAGDPELESGSVSGSFTIREGERSLVAVVASHAAPMIFPDRDALEQRADQTVELWQAWVAGTDYEGPWRDQVERSLLALKLLVYEPDGAMVAAPTTSLPERVGGSRNFDYRFAWVRDTTFALDAVLSMGMREQAHRSFSWLLGALTSTHPRVQPFYRLDGRPPSGQDQLDLAGYRGSEPVNVGNSAADQTQLGNYGDLFETAYAYVEGGALLDRGNAQRLAQCADVVCDVWRVADSGIWELGDKRQYTHSKMACWVALDKALELAARGELPSAHAERWRRTADAIHDFVLERCVSEEDVIVRDAGSRELDAAVLLASRQGFTDPRGRLMTNTIEAVRRELGAGGPLLYRYSGMRDEEGAFVACSYWLADALARAGHADEAAEAIEGMLAHANDIGLMSEEIDPATGELRGNFPQGLSHLAFLSAAGSHADATR